MLQVGDAAHHRVGVCCHLKPTLKRSKH